MPSVWRRPGNDLRAAVENVMPAWVRPRHRDRLIDRETVFTFRLSRVKYFDWGGQGGVHVVDTPIDAVRIEDQSLRGAIARDITVTEGAAGRLVTIKTRCTTTGAANSPPLNVGVDMLDLVR